ncbi:delta subunit of the central stalk of mitochondrial F1F0 ATP synthase, atp16 [Lobulomyces angularis]|nr:delta subunit of the central stalk of mitochondrial F1F0 ATP synthase, atp16 [Lobulomyces angularis]
MISTKVFRRLYATEAKQTGKLLLNLVLPHKTLISKTQVSQVNVSSTEGDMGILADHVPTIAQLKPGVVEVFKTSAADKPEKFFVSGGFAVINPDSSLNINAVEGFTLDDIDYNAAKKASDEANRRLSSATTDLERATAKIELEVYSAIEVAQKAR